jgi:hypothetical protein
MACGGPFKHVNARSQRSIFQLIILHTCRCFSASTMTLSMSRWRSWKLWSNLLLTAILIRYYSITVWSCIYFLRSLCITRSAFKTLEGKLVLIYLLNGYLYFFVSSKMMCKVSLDDSVSLVHSEKFVFSSSLWWALSWHISPLFYVQVLLEFKEYATEVDVDFVRKAVRAIGRCAIKLERAAERCINVLLDLIKMKVNYVVQEAIIVIKDIFRRYPNT